MIFLFSLGAISQVCKTSFPSLISIKNVSSCAEMQVGLTIYIHNTLILTFQVKFQLCTIQESISFCKIIVFHPWWPYWHLGPNHAVNIYSSTRVADYQAPNECMEPVVSHCVEKQKKICSWAHQKVQRMKANTLSLLWSDFGVKVMLFELCPKIDDHRIFCLHNLVNWNSLK